MRHIPIYRDQHVEARLFRRSQKGAVGQSSQPGIAAGIALVPGEMMTEPLVDALVKKNAHSAAGQQGVPRFFQGLQCLLPADGGETF